MVSEVGLFSVTHDRALSPRTKQERDFWVVHMPDWLHMVAITVQGLLVLVRQYRHASRRSGLEVPGGLLDATDSDPAAAAARELREETGYAGGQVVDLGTYWPQPAFTGQPGSLFRGLRAWSWPASRSRTRARTWRWFWPGPVSWSGCWPAARFTTP